MTEISVATYSLTEGDNGSQVSVVFSDGTTETITDHHANFKSIVQALVNKPEGYGPVVYDLANIAKTVGRKFKNLSSRVTTDGSELFFDGDPIDNSLAQFILKLLREDAQKSAAFFGGESVDAGEEASQTTWEALVKFLELLYANPNKGSQESLYEFISRYGLTIRKDGHFIAYKGLNSEFGSKHSGYGIVDGVEVNGTLFNKPGSILRFPRKDVNSNTGVGCAQGLHAGTHAYATQWAGGGKLVAVAINPTNVVSVPDDCTFQKLRVCEYEVLNEVDPLESAIATSGWDSTSFWGDDSDWDDNYSGDTSYDEAIDELEIGDVISFEYISIDGHAQSIADAKVEELDYDQLKAFVPAKDGYRSFKFSGISELSVDGSEDSAEDEADEVQEETQTEAPKEEATKAQSGTEFFNGILDTLRSGKGFATADFLKGFEGLSGDIEDRVKSHLETAKVNSAADFLELRNRVKNTGVPQFDDFLTKVQEQFKGSTKSETAPAVDLEEGATVSFDYTSGTGTSQHIAEARVDEVQADYFKAFVPAKDGYRTFKFEGVSALAEAGKAETASAPSGAIREQLAALSIGDKITVTLSTDGGTETIEGATVLLATGASVTVRLAGSGYKAFTADDVVKLSKN